MRRALLLVSAALLVACPRSRPPAAPYPQIADLPWELEDEVDWAEVRDQLYALPAGDARRHDLRVQLGAAQAIRVGHWLDANRPNLAYEALLELVRLWDDEPTALGADLVGQQPVLERARDVFARSGADAEVVLTEVVLGEVDPAHRAAHWAEIEEVLAYTDELGVAEHGPLGIRARSITVLEPIALSLPLPVVTDRFVGLVVERQRAVNEALDSGGATFELVRAHGDVLRAARAAAAALARARRSPEIVATIAAMVGLGADDELTTRARAVAASGASARAWLGLAQGFRGDEDDPDDPASARAIGLAGLDAFPGDAALLAATADASSAMQRIHEPIRLEEELRRGAGADDAGVADHLTVLYRLRLASLALGDHVTEAQARLAELEAFHAELARQFPGHIWTSTVADALVTMSRGLIAQGELDAAIATLRRAIDLRPDAEAFELLATVAVKREAFEDAREWAERGADLPASPGLGQLTRARLLKLAGDAAFGDDDVAAAEHYWKESLDLWAGLGDASALPPEINGERFVQGGQLLWSLGATDQALKLLEGSVDVDPDGAATHLEVVAFFILHDDYVRALDTFHRAVIADRIGDDHKVYLSLWMVAEARRRGVDPDPLAVEFLEHRDGGLWYDEIARLATGRRGLADLESRATSRGRKAELAYYSAVLDLGADQPRDDAEKRALLEGVVATEVVLDSEYDLARYWLRIPAPGG